MNSSLLYKFKLAFASQCFKKFSSAKLCGESLINSFWNFAGSSGITSGTIVAIVVPITVAVLLFIVGICFLCIRGRKKKHDSAAARDPKSKGAS